MKKKTPKKLKLGKNKWDPKEPGEFKAMPKSLFDLSEGYKEMIRELAKR